MLLEKTRINIQEIIEEYYSSIKNSRGKISKIDKKTFFYFPILLAMVLSLLGNVTNDYIVLIVTTMSIISGLLLNMLLLLTAEAKKIPEYHSDPDTRKQLIKETFSVISYTILLSICIVVILSISYFIDIDKWHFSIKKNFFDLKDFPVIICIIRYTFSLLIMSVIIHIFIHVLLIVRRIHKFFSFEIQ